MLVDKNVALLDELIQMSETAIDAHRYIDQLETEIAELKQSASNTKSNDNIFYMTTLPNIIETIYQPIYSYKQKQQKCNKCKDGFVVQQDSFYTRTRICDCQKRIIVYSVQILNVISTSFVADGEGINTYDCMPEGSAGKIISVNKKNIYDSFSEEHLSMDIGSVFYKSQEDCEEFCRRKNYVEG